VLGAVGERYYWTTGGDGFDLHANVADAANNREGLEQLARDVLRPPILHHAGRDRP
jgi:hypothetical protein